jgi:hypothetical protein
VSNSKQTVVMQCSEFREAAGADPQHLNVDAQAHREQCHACATYLRQMEQLDVLLVRAMKIPVADLSARPLASRPVAGRWLALAASVLVAVVVGMGAWLAAPRESLAADVVEHARNEADIMVTTDQRIDPAALDNALRTAGVRLKSGAQMVSVARTCMFHGRVVPHLIVQTRQGPVTVMVLAKEKVPAVQSFTEAGYRGTIEPSGPGSIAIVAVSADAVAEAKTTFASEVEWVGN